MALTHHSPLSSSFLPRDSDSVEMSFDRALCGVASDPLDMAILENVLRQVEAGVLPVWNKESSGTGAVKPSNPYPTDRNHAGILNGSWDVQHKDPQTAEGTHDELNETPLPCRADSLRSSQFVQPSCFPISDLDKSNSEVNSKHHAKNKHSYSTELTRAASHHTSKENPAKDRRPQRSRSSPVFTGPALTVAALVNESCSHCGNTVAVDDIATAVRAYVTAGTDSEGGDEEDQLASSPTFDLPFPPGGSCTKVPNESNSRTNRTFVTQHLPRECARHHPKDVLVWAEMKADPSRLKETKEGDVENDWEGKAESRSKTLQDQGSTSIEFTAISRSSSLPVPILPSIRTCDQIDGRQNGNIMEDDIEPCPGCQSHQPTTRMLYSQAIASAKNHVPQLRFILPEQYPFVDRTSDLTQNPCEKSSCHKVNCSMQLPHEKWEPVALTRALTSTSSASTVSSSKETSVLTPSPISSSASGLLSCLASVPIPTSASVPASAIARKATGSLSKISLSLDAVSVGCPPTFQKRFPSSSGSVSGHSDAVVDDMQKSPSVQNIAQALEEASEASSPHVESAADPMPSFACVRTPQRTSPSCVRLPPPAPVPARSAPAVASGPALDNTEEFHHGTLRVRIRKPARGLLSRLYGCIPQDERENCHPNSEGGTVTLSVPQDLPTIAESPTHRLQQAPSMSLSFLEAEQQRLRNEALSGTSLLGSKRRGYSKTSILITTASDDTGSGPGSIAPFMDTKRYKVCTKDT